MTDHDHEILVRLQAMMQAQAVELAGIRKLLERRTGQKVVPLFGDGLPGPVLKRLQGSPEAHHERPGVQVSPVQGEGVGDTETFAGEAIGGTTPEPAA